MCYQHRVYQSHSPPKVSDGSRGTEHEQGTMPEGSQVDLEPVHLSDSLRKKGSTDLLTPCQTSFGSLKPRAPSDFTPRGPMAAVQCN